MRFAAVLLAVCLVAPISALGKAKHGKKGRPAPTAGVSSDAEGRSHLKKANALAAHNNCEAAIEEYTLAHDRLNDPAVLLSRAECHRRLGQNNEAAADLRAYLDESPDARNRGEIETKIATLEGLPKQGPSAKPAGAGAAKEGGAGREAAPGAATREPPSRESPFEEAPSVPPARAATAPAPGRSSPPPPPPSSPLPPPAIEPAPAPPAVVEAAPSAASPSVEARPAPARSSGRLWMWTAVAAVVAGGAAAAGYFYFRPADAVPPGTQLGNYRF